MSIFNPKYRHYIEHSSVDRIEPERVFIPGDGCIIEDHPHTAFQLENSPCSDLYLPFGINPERYSNLTYCSLPELINDGMLLRAVRSSICID